MSKYAGTQTEKNLEAAFAGESQARNKYTYFASKAKKEGFEQIAALFLKTADNEKEHAKLWFKELEGIGSTVENLAAAADDKGTVKVPELKVTDEHSLTTRFTVPADAVKGDRFVVNLEVKDNAQRPMTRYAQVVIAVE